MGRSQSDLLKKLVIDTVIWKFDTKTSLRYIEVVGKITISEGHYFRLKRYVLSDEETNYFLQEHMKVGYARNHKLQIEETERIKEPLLKVYYQETSKPYLVQDPAGRKKPDGTPLMVTNKDYDIHKVMKLAKQIDELNKSLDDLNQANPLVQAIKQKLAQETEQQGMEEKHHANVTPTV